MTAAQDSHAGRPLLALDTATPLGTVAIGRATNVLAEVTIGVEARHAESLLPAIDFALRHAGLERSDLGGVIVGGGPGSFTGVRIAGATAKALVSALALPMYAWSSLMMLAAGTGESGPVCALFDARRGEVYAACYQFALGEDGQVHIRTLFEPAGLHVDRVIETLRQFDPLYVGEGALLHGHRIDAAGGRLGHAHLAVPRASALLWLFDSGETHGRVADPARWTPEYLRSPGVRFPGDAHQPLLETGNQQFLRTEPEAPGEPAAQR
ncbi:MAG: tRNA (adenosine(37)-N6)-threonylcarbamoyltransferase complex dimerization subunit type 1 TsaB [Longimicrobiales bacterium]